MAQPNLAKGITECMILDHVKKEGMPNSACNSTHEQSYSAYSLVIGIIAHMIYVQCQRAI